MRVTSQVCLSAFNNFSIWRRHRAWRYVNAARRFHEDMFNWLNILLVHHLTKYQAFTKENERDDTKGTTKNMLE
jgi:hypothetical protein